MDNVVQLAAQARGKERPALRGHQGAEILFFLGVRYCRYDAPVAEPQPATEKRVSKTPKRAGGSGRKRRA